MTKEEKKKLLDRYRKIQKNEFASSLPMPAPLFRDLFDFLDRQLEGNACKHNFENTTTFLKENRCPVDAVLEWLDKNGAGCDCEVLSNIEEKFEKIG